MNRLRRAWKRIRMLGNFIRAMALGLRRWPEDKP